MDYYDLWKPRCNTWIANELLNNFRSDNDKDNAFDIWTGIKLSVKNKPEERHFSPDVINKAAGCRSAVFKSLIFKIPPRGCFQMHVLKIILQIQLHNT